MFCELEIETALIIKNSTIQPLDSVGVTIIILAKQQLDYYLVFPSICLQLIKIGGNSFV